MTQTRIAPAIFAVLPLALTASMLVFGSPFAGAQDTTTAGTPGGYELQPPMTMHVRTFERFRFMGSMGKVVTNKPYTATAVTETEQTLPDGNRIVHTNQATFYRDSAGRTRREQTIHTLGTSSPDVSKQIIVISDPVAQVEYVLDPTDKTARETTSFRRGKLTEPKQLSDLPMGKHFDDSKNVTKQDLGTQTIAGVQCTGTRITRTIPAGEIGNEKPIVSVKEVWYSADIDSVVQSKSTDPRFGTTTYTLSDVKLGNPAQTLFAPPADYKVEQMTRPRTRKTRGIPGAQSIPDTTPGDAPR